NRKRRFRHSSSTIRKQSTLVFWKKSWRRLSNSWRARSAPFALLRGNRSLRAWRGNFARKRDCFVAAIYPERNAVESKGGFNGMDRSPSHNGLKVGQNGYTITIVSGCVDTAAETGKTR